MIKWIVVAVVLMASSRDVHAAMHDVSPITIDAEGASGSVDMLRGVCVAVGNAYQRVPTRSINGWVRRESFVVLRKDYDISKVAGGSNVVRIYNDGFVTDNSKRSFIWFRMDLYIDGVSVSNILHINNENPLFSSIVFFKAFKRGSGYPNPRPVFSYEKLSGLVVGGNSSVDCVSVESEGFLDVDNSLPTDKNGSDRGSHHDPLGEGIVPRTKVAYRGYNFVDFVLVGLCLGLFLLCLNFAVDRLTEPRRKNDRQ